MTVTPLRAASTCGARRPLLEQRRRAHPSAGRGDRDCDGQAAVRPGAGGGGAAVDRGDGGDDGQAESEAVMGGAVAEPLERLEDAVGVRPELMTGPVLATISWLQPSAVRVLIQMSPAATL